MVNSETNHGNHPFGTTASQDGHFSLEQSIAHRDNVLGIPCSRPPLSQPVPKYFCNQLLRSIAELPLTSVAPTCKENNQRSHKEGYQTYSSVSNCQCTCCQNLQISRRSAYDTCSLPVLATLVTSDGKSNKDMPFAVLPNFEYAL